jgi:uncharacterized protein (DUF1778 family)
MRKPKSAANRPARRTSVEIRLRANEKDVIARAARLGRTTLEKFITEHAFLAAQQVLAEQTHFTLSPRRWEAFCKALDAPPREIPALKRLFGEAQSPEA